MDNFKLLLCNTNSIDNAKEIAQKIIANNHAACVNIIPNVISIYEWEDKIETEQEFTMLIKTSLGKIKSIEKIIKQMHTYDHAALIPLPLRGALRRDAIYGVKSLSPSQVSTEKRAFFAIETYIRGKN